MTDTSVHEIWIGADTDRVFAALTEHEGLDGWWGPVVRADREPGGSVEFDHGTGGPITMEIVALEAPRRVVWRCVSRSDDSANPSSEWTGQTFEWTVAARTKVPLLAATLDVCVVQMVNRGWPSPSRWQGFCSTAWSVTLETKLKPYCEDGTVTTGHADDSVAYDN